MYGYLPLLICIGLSFNAVKNLLFTKMIESITNYGKRFKPPCHEFLVTSLKKEVGRINVGRFRKIQDRRERDKMHIDV